MDTVRPLLLGARGIRPLLVIPLAAHGLALALLLLLARMAGADQPVFRVVKGEQAGVALLRNGDFEQVEAGKPVGWDAAPQGCRLAPGEGRGDSQALCAENLSGNGWVGASQTLVLRRTNTSPLMVRGWSKAENVGGAADTDYSLYVDITYTDGTPLYGQTAQFRTGSHDWERRQVVILPEKPVKSLTLHCLFRNHPGKVWFDDLTVEEIQAGQGAILLQGVPVVLPQAAPHPSGKAAVFHTQDGLQATWRGDRIASLRVDGRELALPAPSGFLARDVAANSDVFAFEKGECRDLGLKLQASC